jgi:hypothetical protein
MTSPCRWSPDVEQRPVPTVLRPCSPECEQCGTNACKEVAAGSPIGPCLIESHSRLPRHVPLGGGEPANGLRRLVTSWRGFADSVRPRLVSGSSAARRLGSTCGGSSAHHRTANPGNKSETRGWWLATDSRGYVVRCVILRRFSRAVWRVCPIVP